VGRGLPLADGTRLTYKVRFPFLLSTFALLNRPQYNGQFAFATTLVVATILHFTGIFRVTEWYLLVLLSLPSCGAIASPPHRQV
jgi:hypothetical protein